MFGWLKRGKPAHPMADPEHVQELIASLSASDPAKALERISGWLDGVTHAKAPELPLRWRDPVDPRRAARSETLAGGRSARRRSGWRRSAVLLVAEPDESDETVVVMRIAGEAKEAAAGHYLAIQRLTMQFNEARPHVLQPAGLMEGGEDFDCARFRVLRL